MFHQEIYGFPFRIVTLHPHFSVDNIEVKHRRKNIVNTVPAAGQELKTVVFAVNEDTALDVGIGGITPGF